MLFRFVAPSPKLHTVLKRYGLTLPAGCALGLAVHSRCCKRRAHTPSGAPSAGVTTPTTCGSRSPRRRLVLGEQSIPARRRSPLRNQNQKRGPGVPALLRPDRGRHRRTTDLRRLERPGTGRRLAPPFNWGQFAQNYHRRCSAKANPYAGTFSGGMVSRGRAQLQRTADVAPRSAARQGR